VVALLAIAAYIVVRDLIRGYWTTRGAGTEHYTLHSRLVHRELHEIRVVPAQHGNWTLVLLHGRGGGPSGMLSQSLFDALHDLGSRAPVVLLPDGGDHSYWHNPR
jgi:poly(3-hydroxybutyrate) depolymerase